MTESLALMQLRTLATVARVIDADEIRRFVAAREHAMAFGPIFQPTSWIEHGFNADRAFVELAEATLAYLTTLDKVAAALGVER